VKDNEFEVAPGDGFTTVMGTVPVAAISAALIEAVTRVLLTKLVVRGEPFHRTTAPFTKPVPLTVSVNADPPAAALLGESDVAVIVDWNGN